MSSKVIKDVNGNLVIKDCPVLIPKENMNLFSTLHDAVQVTDNMNTKNGNFGNVPK